MTFLSFFFFLWCKFGFGKCFAASLKSNYWAGFCRLSHKIHFFSHDTIESRNGSLLLCRLWEDNISKWRFFFICCQVMRHPLIELFHLSNLLQMLNDGRVVDVGFFGNFLCTYKRISSRDCSQLIVVNFWWLATMLFIFKALVSFAKLLKPSLHCVLIRNSWARCIVDVASCLCCFMTHFELK